MEAMRRFFFGALILLLGASASAQAGGPYSAGNGFIIFVHATFEPNIYDASSTLIPPVPETLAATNDGGFVVFNVIPHGLDGRPVIVSNPRLEITATDGRHRGIDLSPNGASASQPECVIETQAPGFEGPVQACQVFRLPASTFEGMPLVDLTFRFTDAQGAQVELNNLPAHLLLHAFQGGAPVDLAQVDRDLTGTVTPFAVQSLIDPEP